MGWAGCRWCQDHHSSPRGLGVTGQPGGKEAGGKEGMDRVGALRHHPEELEGKKIRKKIQGWERNPFLLPPKALAGASGRYGLSRRTEGRVISSFQQLTVASARPNGALVGQ